MTKRLLPFALSLLVASAAQAAMLSTPQGGASGPSFYTAVTGPWAEPISRFIAHPVSKDLPLAGSLKALPTAPGVALGPIVAELSKVYSPLNFSILDAGHRYELVSQAITKAQAAVAAEAKDMIAASKQEGETLKDTVARLELLKGPLAFYLDEGLRKEVVQAHEEAKAALILAMIDKTSASLGRTAEEDAVLGAPVAGVRDEVRLAKKGIVFFRQAVDEVQAEKESVRLIHYVTFATDPLAARLVAEEVLRHARAGTSRRGRAGLIEDLAEMAAYAPNEPLRLRLMEGLTDLYDPARPQDNLVIIDAVRRAAIYSQSPAVGKKAVDLINSSISGQDLETRTVSERAIGEIRTIYYRNSFWAPPAPQTPAEAKKAKKLIFESAAFGAVFLVLGVFLPKALFLLSLFTVAYAARSIREMRLAGEKTNYPALGKGLLGMAIGAALAIPVAMAFGLAVPVQAVMAPVLLAAFTAYLFRKARGERFDGKALTSGIAMFGLAFLVPGAALGFGLVFPLLIAARYLDALRNKAVFDGTPFADKFLGMALGTALAPLLMAVFAMPVPWAIIGAAVMFFLAAQTAFRFLKRP